MGVKTPARLGATRLALARAGPRRTAVVVAAARSSHEAAVAANARRKRVPIRLRHPVVVAGPRRATVRVSLQRQPTLRGLRARRVVVRSVRRQLELARPDLAADELPAHRVAAEVPSLLRRRF